MPTAPTRRAGQRGGAAVEFGIVLALLVTLLAGIFGFGRAFWYYDALSKASRDGARAMSISAKASINSAGVAAARQVVLDAAASAGVPGLAGANVSVVCLDASFNDSVCSDGTAPAGVRVAIVNYTLSVGQYLPFVIGANSSYTTPLSPRTTMPYML
ncbi:TadE/TadG family type IV pilus assembly protein [Janthinobacterium fluminis]|uniref:TadE/TadG family type IV pilus assembly protein n=1 Tax=Janthinobacterium fluminis TaxID=2987524 RepID=A0ABT5K663_9BURK|nr:TadE/TadG family type IV pilus assembly protein [Janthinobacterium fluminis]MDC8759252.1 TadE/TadG family type IV pilus assembly protein [Janthinobacterium fluminis]